MFIQAIIFDKDKVKYLNLMLTMVSLVIDATLEEVDAQYKIVGELTKFIGAQIHKKAH